MRQKGSFLLFLAVIFVVPLLFLQNNSNKRSETKTKSNQTLDLAKPELLYKVTKVVDGDTIEIEGGYKVRYIGIDTPETVDPNREIGCYGKEAAKKNKDLVEGKKVRLEKDVSETDKYGRILAYVYQGDTFVNNVLVHEGFAKAYSYPPDVKFQEKFRESEKYAQENNKGLWDSCSHVFGLLTTDNEKTSSINSGNCNIKGNINSSGEKIYHLQEQKDYDKTEINEDLGERWFCTEDDAQNAGWRKAKS